jgi:putative tryptophan/tyrosine transport system substrate-binding protein
MHSNRLKRREFITLLGGAATWSFTARAAQQRIPTIGILVPANPEPFWSKFRASLREPDYIEGQNIAFEFRSADGNSPRLRELADDLVRLKVNIIVAALTPAATAARQATTEIPIVMVSVGDPVGTGLISSLARPGGNITGVASGGDVLSAKTIELIRDVLPAPKRVAALANAPDPFSRVFVEQVEDAGRMLGVAIQTIKIRSIDELDAAFSAMIKEQADAFVVQLSLPRKPILDLALKLRLPLFAASPLLAQEGALMSYSTHQGDLYHRAAVFVDRILKGAKPADLPVELPVRFELVINLKTAKALGISVPPEVIDDEVIE